MALISVLSLSRIGRGVLPGATIICQAVVSKPGTPTLASGGISGAAGDGSALVMPSARALPARINWIDGPISTNSTSMLPEIRSVMAGTLPLLGTCVILMPVMLLNSSALR